MATLGKWPSVLNCGIRFVPHESGLELCLLILPQLSACLFLLGVSFSSCCFTEYVRVDVCTRRGVCVVDGSSVGPLVLWVKAETDYCRATQSQWGSMNVYNYFTLIKHSHMYLDSGVWCMCKQTSITMSQPISFTSATSINLLSLINLVAFQSWAPVLWLSHCRHIRLWQPERPNWSAPLFFTGVTGKMGQSKIKPEGWIWSNSLLAFKVEPVRQKCIVWSGLINSGVKFTSYVNEIIKYSMHNPPSCIY